jgi:hypothetical protein
VDAIEIVNFAVNNAYLTYTSWSLVGSTLLINYPDGATETYTGFVIDNANLDKGTASATGYEFHLKDQLVMTYAGKLNLDYVRTTGTSGASLSVSDSIKGLTINDVRYALQLPSTDPDYDPVYGNGAIEVKGALNLLPSGAVSGTISQLLVTAEKFLISETIDGDFHVSGNLVSDGQQQTHSVVTGALTGYHQLYQDGSHVDVSGLSAELAAPYEVDETLLANPLYFAGNDNINIELPAVLPSDFLMASGAGDDRLTIQGGGGRFNVNAGDGNDQITVLGDAHHVEGGTGMDTVILQSARANYHVVHNDLPADPRVLQPVDMFVVTDKAGAASNLTGVERIQFADATIALDINGNAGQAYRLYQAAFNRTPDKVGLGFWINAMDSGSSLISVSQGFVVSNEFKDAYGVNRSNHDLVSQFYQNILHRAPEEGGLNFWVGVLDNKQVGVADVLAGISESAENKAGLIGVIGNGIEFTPYHP